ncbi:LemA family protein [Candidatus Laterigemmans baculatus]|uniref:LemA family protein n=1 Tax=Candidatus Laterigemmans baculatus TaxID=2770505 RepID=UPI00193BBABC|nr:LemA family protein [Candidatus Laterigemmans baculatus]
MSYSMSGGLLLVLGIVVLLGLLFVAYGVSVYNHLVTLRNRVDNAFSQIEVQLRRRHDLIPNLVETAKGYLSHERETLEAVIAARNQAVGGLKEAAGHLNDPAAMQRLASAESGLGGALGRLFAVAEAYPDLKANQNMLQLTEELTSTENRISFARQGYNDSVTAYNTYKQTFPPVIVAKMAGHSEDRALLQFDSEKLAEPPTVSFR